MSNTHTLPDTLAETMAREADLLPAGVISATWPTVPVSSMTLQPFGTQAYVRDGELLYYVEQAAISLTLTGGNGAYWLAIHKDTHSAASGWTRRPGSHYLWRSSATQPADPAGGLVFAAVTVAGGVITAVTIPAYASGRDQVAYGGATGGLAYAPLLRWNNAVGGLDVQGYVLVRQGLALNGEPAQPGRLVVYDAPAGATSALRTLTTAGANRYQLYCEGTAQNYINGLVGFQTGLVVPPDLIRVSYHKANQHALTFKPDDNDTGPGLAVLFQNAAGTTVGAINCTATGTTYGTTSDRRVKEGIEALTEALPTLQRLLPRRFRWQADGTPGVGFVADEVQAVVPEAVTGTPDGPQMQGVDVSKLVPYLVSALQALVQRVEALEAR